VVSLDAFDFLVIVFLNIGHFFRGRDGLEQPPPSSTRFRRASLRSTTTGTAPGRRSGCGGWTLRLPLTRMKPGSSR
jgi:hypothetical protein